MVGAVTVSVGVCSEQENWSRGQLHTCMVCHCCVAPFAAGAHSKPVVVDLVGRQVKVSQDTGIFITMNPDYAGRSNLPDNLKQLFRSLAMTKPDRQLIAEVMLYSQGFKKAERLAAKAVPFFKWVPCMCVCVCVCVHDTGPYRVGGWR